MKLPIQIVIFLTFLSWPAKSNGQSDAQTNQPNIVIIMADDLGYGDFSCQGATKISTPHIDSLASDGLRFTDAHTASSLCTPSRYGLLTGRYPWRTRLRSGVLTWFGRPLIDRGQTTLASLLKRNGYETACIGKWHLGFEWALKPNAPDNPTKNVFDSWEVSAQDYIDFSKPVNEGPTQRGFDYYFGISASNNMIPFVYIENNKVLEPPNEKKEYVYDTDQKSTRASDWHLETIDQTLTQKAVGVINDHFHKYKNQPLFLYFPTSAIHRPCLPTFTKGKSRAGLRGDMVVEFDWIVGQIVAALKANKAFNNTLLIVTSDNGGVPGDALFSLERYRRDLGDKYYLKYFDDFQPMFKKPKGNPMAKEGWLTYGHPSSGKFLGFKSDAWEGGHRVPLIMHWPGKIKAGQVDSNMVCNTDLMATFADLVNDHLSVGEGEDSYSYLQNILGISNKQVRRTMTLVGGGSGAFVVRMGMWKYIEPGKPAWGQTYYADGPKATEFQLYNLASDPYEQNNLYTKEPERIRKFRALISSVEMSSMREDEK